LCLARNTAPFTIRVLFSCAHGYQNLWEMAGEVSIASSHAHLRYSTFRLPCPVVIQTFITADSVSRVHTEHPLHFTKPLARSRAGTVFRQWRIHFSVRHRTKHSLGTAKPPVQLIRWKKGWSMKHSAQVQLHLHSSCVFVGWNKIRCNSAPKTKVTGFLVTLVNTYKTI